MYITITLKMSKSYYNVKKCRDLKKQNKFSHTLSSSDTDMIRDNNSDNDSSNSKSDSNASGNSNSDINNSDSDDEEDEMKKIIGPNYNFKVKNKIMCTRKYWSTK